MTTSADVRSSLTAALEMDLIGPKPADEAQSREVLPERPTSFYLTGFLAPRSAPQKQRGAASDGNDENDDVVVKHAGPEDDKKPDRQASRPAFFPASMGLTVLVPTGVKELKADVTFGEYRVDDATGHWTRQPGTATCTVPLGNASAKVELPGTGGLAISVAVRPLRVHSRLPAGTHAVSVFLVNDRQPAPDVKPDEAFIFQPRLVLSSSAGFVARPNLRSSAGEGFDEEVADLQYRDAVEFAVGHNVGAEARVEQGKCHEVSTTFLPCAEVEKVVPGGIPGVELRLEELAACESLEALKSKLGALVPAYGQWIDAQPVDFGDKQRDRTALELVARAKLAAARLEAGLDSLVDAQALTAFRLMNRAVATAMRRRSAIEENKSPDDLPPPTWRPFQIAFILLNLAGIIDPKHREREVVDLLFFPTGGGKTEAYLGLSAFTMLLRRLRDPSARSSGVTVLMRYTLRLLTLDQLVRASTLICALELLRQADELRLGKWPFEIGLWVGLAATPNRMGKAGDKSDSTARKRTNDFKREPKRFPSPIPIEACPWCGTRFNEKSFELRPDANEPEELHVFCTNRACAFHTNKQPRGMPLVAVDEPIYRRLPAFVIATVDKFASMPWVGQTGALFGRVDRHDANGFYGPCDPNRGAPLGGMLSPPDLVIQDELHLISGPLGTMVGLYETAIDELCTRTVAGVRVRPKIIASTATVRRAAQQIQALFARSQVDIFPPPGPERRDSFFARTAPVSERNARLYVGVAAQGRNAKVVMLRAYLALLGAAQKAWKEAGGDKNPNNPADPYMTLLGYFNALRELGGARTIVADEVVAKGRKLSERRRVGEDDGLLADREVSDPVELTSRVGTGDVSRTRALMSTNFAAGEAPDVVLATNMISVGLDVTRLGLMVVSGQPKTAAEYIQATSRVGRDDARPGLVVTLLNLHKPRDRSHYEHFTPWHESFYRSVEVTSVTPFSPRAIDRGIAAVTVALARLLDEPMAGPKGARAISANRTKADRVADIIAGRAEAHANLSAPEAEELRQSVRERVRSLLDSWERVAENVTNLVYGNESVGGKPLLQEPLDPESANLTGDHRRFKAHRSLRDVEPGILLHLLAENAR